MSMPMWVGGWVENAEKKMVGWEEECFARRHIISMTISSAYLHMPNS